MIFVDAGYLIATIDRRDALHVRAHAWSRSVQEPLVLTNLVLVEALNHLSAVPDRAGVHRIVRGFLSLPTVALVTVDHGLLEAGLALHRDRPDKAWSLTDCISFVVMEQRGITRALAYDRHFEQAGFEPLLRREP